MRFSMKAIIATMCCSWVLPTFAMDPELDTSVTIEHMRYGKYEFNILDLYVAVSDTPTPLAIFIHGGGFKSGSRAQAVDADGDLGTVQELLAAGISVASIDYRLTRDKEYTLENILQEDMTLAVQMLRHRAASLNIDPTRIGAWGNSAGAGAALYLGVADDIAVPNSPDPIRRQSSKVQVVGHLAGQATYDVRQWAALASVDESWMEYIDFEDDLYWFNVENRDEITSEMYEKVDITSLFSADDATIYSENIPANSAPEPIVIDENISSDDDKETARIQIAHHEEHAKLIGSKCTEVGLTCKVVTELVPLREGDEQEGLVHFFKQNLLP